MKQSAAGAVYPRMTTLLRVLFVALLCATVIATSLAGGCSGRFGPTVVRGSGTVNTETRDAANFSEVRLTGSGDATVNAGDRLEANVSGSGSVLYEGNPQVEEHISGSGEIARR